MSGDDRIGPPREGPSGDGGKALFFTAGEGALFDGRYRLVRLIGRGASGAVYEAEDTALGGTAVAIKLFAIPGGESYSDARLQREARLLFRLGHPNIVTPLAIGRYESGDGEEIPYLVLELLRGPTLATQIAVGKLQPQQLISVLTQLAQALSYLHREGVVHRDLKPSNLILANDGTLKLLDFGIARDATLNDSVKAATDIGTLAYVAPELYGGVPASPRSDVYAFGLLALELFVGHITPPESMQQNLLGQSERLALLVREAEGMPRWLRKVVIRCIAANPFDRFTDGVDLEQAFIRRAHSVAERFDFIERLLPYTRQRAFNRRAQEWAAPALIVLALVVFLGWRSPLGWIARDPFGPHGHANLRFLRGLPLEDSRTPQQSLEDRESLLCSSLEQQDNDTALALIREGTHECSVFEPMTALVKAAESGMTEVIEELLKHGANPNDRLMYQSAASVALGRGNLEAFKVLRKVSEPEYCGWDVRRLAFECDPAFVLAFLDAGGTFDDKIHGCVGGSHEFTVGERLMLSGCPAVVETILRHATYPSVPLRNSDLQPMLNVVAHYGDVFRIRLFLEYNRHPQPFGNEGIDALHSVIASPYAPIDSIRPILTTPWLKLTRQLSDGRGYVQFATYHRNPDAVALLLRNKFQTEQVDVLGLTALDIAVDPNLISFGAEETPRWLTQNPFFDDEGFSIQLSLLLLAAGADPMRRSPDGYSPFERATKAGCLRCLELFELARNQ